MAYTNCTDQGKNIINPPMLLGNEQLNINSDLMARFKQGQLGSLFQSGISLRDLVLDSKSGMKLAEIGAKPSFLDKWKVNLACKGGGYFVNLRRGF
jgi:hypothetical protein